VLHLVCTRDAHVVVVATDEDAPPLTRNSPSPQRRDLSTALESCGEHDMFLIIAAGGVLVEIMSYCRSASVEATEVSKSERTRRRESGDIDVQSIILELNCLPFSTIKICMEWKIEACIDLKGIIKKWRE
jgi:hypothetical protein